MASSPPSACKIEPEDSISNSGSSGFGTSVDFSDPRLLSCIVSLGEFQGSIREFGIESTMYYMGFAERQQALIVKMLSVQAGGMRVAARSSVGSVSSCPRVEKTCGSRGGSAMSDVRSRLEGVEGLCYSRMLKRKGMQHTVERLGAYPTVSALLRSPASAFKSVDAMRNLRLEGDSSLVHVSSGGGHSLLQTVARYASGVKCSAGTFGAVLNAAKVDFSGAGDLVVKGSTKIGGVGVGRTKPESERLAGVRGSQLSSRVVPVDSWKHYVHTSNGKGPAGKRARGPEVVHKYSGSALLRLTTYSTQATAVVGVKVKEMTKQCLLNRICTKLASFSVQHGALCEIADPKVVCVGIRIKGNAGGVVKDYFVNVLKNYDSTDNKFLSLPDKL